MKPTPALRLAISGIYVMDREDGFGAAQRRIEDYLRLRLTASYQVCENFELFARVENLIGEKYQEVLGFPAMRTGAYAGFKLRF